MLDTLKFSRMPPAFVLALSRALYVDRPLTQLLSNSSESAALPVGGVEQAWMYSRSTQGCK